MTKLAIAATGSNEFEVTTPSGVVVVRPWANVPGWHAMWKFDNGFNAHPNARIVEVAGIPLSGVTSLEAIFDALEWVGADSSEILAKLGVRT